MNGLKVQDFHGKKVIDSRDVAEMVERGHYDLLKSIRQYTEYLAEGEIPLGDFFIESTYLDANNQIRPNFLITKKGCDMIANKTTGKKGVLFTASYVTAFDEMQQALTAPRTPALPDGVTFSNAVGFMRLTRRVMLDMGASPFEVGMMIKQTCEAVSFPVPPALTQQLQGQLDLFGRPVQAAVLAVRRWHIRGHGMWSGRAVRRMGRGCSVCSDAGFGGGFFAASYL